MEFPTNFVLGFVALKEIKIATFLGLINTLHMYLVNSVCLYGQITKLHSFLKDTPLQVQFYYKFYSQGILIKKTQFKTYQGRI